MRVIHRPDRRIEYKKGSSEEARELPDHPSSHSLLVERGRRKQRVSDEFVSVFESDNFLMEVDDPFRCFPKEKGITEIPVPE